MVKSVYISSSALGKKLVETMDNAHANWEYQYLNKIRDVFRHFSNLNKHNFLSTLNDHNFMEKKGSEVTEQIFKLTAIEENIKRTCKEATKYFKSKAVLKILKEISYEFNEVRFAPLLGLFYYCGEKHGVNSVYGVERLKSFHLWKKGIVYIDDKDKLHEIKNQEKYLWLGKSYYGSSDEKALRHLFDFALDDVEKIRKQLKQIYKKAVILSKTGKGTETIYSVIEAEEAIEALGLTPEEYPEP